MDDERCVLIEARDGDMIPLQVDMFCDGYGWAAFVDLWGTELFKPRYGGMLLIDRLGAMVPLSEPAEARSYLGSLIHDIPITYPEDSDRMYRKLHELTTMVRSQIS